MSLLQLGLIVLTILAIATGQILFKIAAGGADFSTVGGFVTSLVRPSFIAALVVYLGATVMWLIVLKLTPLRIAYPFVALTFFVVPVLAYVFLKEDLSWGTFAGGGLIALGVWISVIR